MQKKDDNKMTMKPSISNVQRQQIMSRTKSLISHLTDLQMLKGRQVQITELEITNICVLLNEVLLEEPSCLNLQVDSTMYVLGDLHGQYTRLLQVLNGLGHPPQTSYLFLGNYVNRGEKSMETIVLLFAYKLLYPKSIYLLRGAHECDQLGRRYGFYAECTRRFTARLWKVLMNTFNYLPAAALIENTVFCTHSGISPTLMYSGFSGPHGLQEYLTTWIVRPTEIEANLLLTQLIWSEPDAECTQWERNPAGLGYLYGPKEVEQFCDQFHLQQIIRSNDLLSNGFEFLQFTKLVTICSQPDFLGLYQNSGAVVELTRVDKQKTILGRIKRLRMTVSNRGKSMGRSTLIIESIGSVQRLGSKTLTVEDETDS